MSIITVLLKCDANHSWIILKYESEKTKTFGLSSWLNLNISLTFIIPFSSVISILSLTLMLGVELLIKNIDLQKEINKNKLHEQERKKTISFRRIK